MQQSVFLLSVIKVIDYLLEDFDSPNISFICKVLCLAVSYNLGVDKIKPRDNKYFSPMIGLTEPCKTLFTNFFQK